MRIPTEKMQAKAGGTIADHFDAIDTDRDGNISFEELFHAAQVAGGEGVPPGPSESEVQAQVERDKEAAEAQLATQRAAVEEQAAALRRQQSALDKREATLEAAAAEQAAAKLKAEEEAASLALARKLQEEEKAAVRATAPAAEPEPQADAGSGTDDDDFAAAVRRAEDDFAAAVRRAEDETAALLEAYPPSPEDEDAAEPEPQGNDRSGTASAAGGRSGLGSTAVVPTTTVVGTESELCAAVEAVGTVVVKAGTRIELTSKRGILIKRPIRLVGEGKDDCGALPTIAGAQGACDVVRVSGNGMKVELEGLRIEGGGDDTDNVLSVSNGSSLVAMSCEFVDNMVLFNGKAHVELRECTVSGSKGRGMFAYGGASVTMEGGVVRGCTDAGIIVDEAGTRLEVRSPLVALISSASGLPLLLQT
jgi:hypothetical protein